MIYVVLFLIAFAGFFTVCVTATNFGRVMLDTNRKRRLESDKALNKAEKALRSIANGAGSPVLEAQIALDEISIHREKELN
jgi:hypothetical protein